ncbi:sigma-70 family RNA polymerase sigma factor [Larkinella ripae]
MNLQPEKDRFLALIEDHKKIIFKVCNSYCKDAEDRKDLVQEVIIQLWQSMSRYNNQYKLSTWIYRIALNVAISFYRSEHTRKKQTSSIHDSLIDIADEDPESESNSTLLHHFINQLDELNRALMILYLDDKSYREMADILGISETNVATKISRIKQRLKAQFSKL